MELYLLAAGKPLCLEDHFVILHFFSDNQYVHKTVSMTNGSQFFSRTCHLTKVLTNTKCVSKYFSPLFFLSQHEVYHKRRNKDALPSK